VNRLNAGLKWSAGPVAFFAAGRPGLAWVTVRHNGRRRHHGRDPRHGV